MNDTRDRAELEAFLAKWRAQWPAWPVAEAFVPGEQRHLAMAWFALLDEWLQAALGGRDAAPGLAKLAWWQEELRGWSRGARRHPLGTVLQRQPVAWTALADALAVWRHRDALAGSAEGFRTTIAPFAQAAAAVENGMWPQARIDAQAMAVLLLAQALQQGLCRDDACAVLEQWPMLDDASPARRQLASMQRQNLQAGPVAPRPRWQALQTLLRAWQTARN